VLGSGTLTVGATSIASGTDGAITAASVAQLETLLPKAGAALNAGLANSGTLAADATVKAGTVLTIASGKNLDVGTHKLILGAATAAISGEGKVVAGNTTITGGASGTWTQAGAGTIAIAANAITASAATAILTGGSADTAIIEVTAGEATDSTLTVTGTIDIATNGAVKLTGSAAKSAILSLTSGTIPGKLSANVSAGSAFDAVVSLTDTSATVGTLCAITKGGGSATTTGGSAGTFFNILGGASGNALTITSKTGSANALTILKTAKLA
jgi:hypothetical protein